MRPKLLMWTLERAIAELECVLTVVVCAAIGSTDQSANNVATARYFEMKSFLYICEVSLVIKNRIFSNGRQEDTHGSELVVSGKGKGHNSADFSNSHTPVSAGSIVFRWLTAMAAQRNLSPG
jgi:hypothetical protein